MRRKRDRGAFLGDHHDQITPLRAGRVHVVADLQQVNHGREQARVIDVLDVVEPDAGSVAVVCMDALKEDARPVA